jgi:putative hydrolase of the HAD superfamily
MVKAVLFDLYNTLLYIDPNVYREAKRQMAEKVHVPKDLFLELWRQYSRSNNRGDILTVEERVALVLRDLGLTPGRNLINEIAAIEYDLQENGGQINKDAIKVISQLKGLNLKCGLISNTGFSTYHVPELLGISSYFDTIIFSFLLRSLKPGSAIYQRACQNLSVMPNECVYVGDGDDLEIEGAHNYGMVSVLLNEGRSRIVHTNEPQNYYRAISNLSEIIEIVKELL